MSDDQQRFEAGMKKILSISPEEMKRRIAEDKAARKARREARLKAKKAVAASK